MKRDPVYELSLLRKIEAAEEYVFPFVYGMDEETKKEWDHLHLLLDQGLIAHEGSTWRLTHNGHEVLELENKGYVSKAIKKHGYVTWAILIEAARLYLTTGG